MADLATDDPRGARFERRMRPPLLVAAVAVLPLLALHLTHPHGTLALIETARGPGAGAGGRDRRLMLTGSSALEGAERTVVLIVAGMLATFGVNHLRLRAAPAARVLT